MAVLKYTKTHLTSSAVVAQIPGASAGVVADGDGFHLGYLVINTAAATAVINVYDWNSTTTPQNLIHSITIGTTPNVPISLECHGSYTIGITVTIATAAADVTVYWI